MPGRTQAWVWVFRVLALVIVAVLAGYLKHVGLDDADKLASSLALLVAVLSLVAPYLLPPADARTTPAPERSPDVVKDSGTATATAGGQANTGAQVAGERGPARVVRSGDANATGAGSVANTGIQQPSPGPQAGSGPGSGSGHG